MEEISATDQIFSSSKRHCNFSQFVVLHPWRLIATNNCGDLFAPLCIALTLYYSTVGLLKPTLVTNSNYLNLVRNKNLKFPDFSYLFFPIMMKLFLFIQHKGFKRKMGVFDNFLKILPISSFWCKILILRKIFLVEIKRIRVNWCPRLDGLQ